MSLINCFDRAQAMNVISAEEARKFKDRIRQMIKDNVSEAEIRARMAKEVETEAKHRERAAILTELKRVEIEDVFREFRDRNGYANKALAFRLMHENFGQEGTYVKDVVNLQQSIVAQAQRELRVLLHELRKGAITGDLRRSRKRVAARMDNLVRELFGQNTGDVRAAEMARAWEKVSEDLRIRFNAAGGNIPKLDRWGLPQGHSAEALLGFKKAPWVAYMMKEGVLDLDRMKHPLHGNKMTPGELKESLEVVWDRVTTDGLIDAELTVGGGKGALYTQHTDHRFIHFKSPDAWLAYAKKFGSTTDPFAAIIGHINLMARDIAQMEVFGPNPTLMREYMKNLIKKDAATIDALRVIQDELNASAGQLAASTGVDGWHKVWGVYQDEVQVAVDRLEAAKARLGQPKAPRVGKTPRWHDMEGAKEAVASAVADLETAKAKFDAWFGTGNFEEKFSSPDTSPVVPFDQLMKAKQEFEALHKDMVSVTRGDARFDTTARAMAYVNKTINLTDNMWTDMRGGVQEGNHALAERMQSVRSFITSASLGSAWLSSIADPSFGKAMRKRLAMGLATSSATRIAIQTVRYMIDRRSVQEAADAMLGIDAASRVLRRKAEEVKGIDHRFYTDFLADRTLANGLLSPWTQGGKHSFGFDFMTQAGRLVATTSWGDLPPQFKRVYEHIGGITEADWIQLAKVTRHEGRLRPTEVIAFDRQLGERYHQMILRTTRHAVPEATVEARALWNAGLKPGTYPGELVRSMMQFKGFGATVVMLRARQIADMHAHEGLRSTFGFEASLFVTMATLGAVSMALKDMKDGRDPRKWLDEKTYLDYKMWGAAFLQAGGLGIYGDFLFSENNRFGGGLEKTIAGPLLGRVGDVIELGIAEPYRAIKGEKTNPGRNAVQILRGSIPLGNHWLWSTALQRQVFDRLMREADPDAPAAFAREIARRQKDFNQTYWWRPGSPTPDRAPDLSRIFATR